jgi:hypothetical protein
MDTSTISLAQRAAMINGYQANRLDAESQHLNLSASRSGHLLI